MMASVAPVPVRAQGLAKVGVLSVAALVAAQSPARFISYLRTCMFRYRLHFC